MPTYLQPAIRKDVFILVAIILPLLFSCNKTPPIGGPGSELDPTELANILENKLKDNCVGYAFTISYKQNQTNFRSGGEARRSQDPPERVMGIWDKFNAASISKTITATALMRLLLDKDNVGLNSPFWTYLPSHWTVHNSIKGITFAQLLTHKSGFRFSTNVSYAEEKQNMAAGVNPNDIGQYDYNNNNYGILRIVIPILNGNSIININSRSLDFLIAAQEIAQAQQLADYYISYVQAKVFDKTGGAMQNMACKPTDVYPALCYQFPKTNANGTDFGDMTLTCGSRGWNISASQMGLFFRQLHYTTNILPKSLSDKMKNELMGYDDKGTTKDGISYYWKNGFYPGSMNPGEINAWLVGFSNDIQIALIINSQFEGSNSIGMTIIQSFQEWYQ